MSCERSVFAGLSFDVLAVLQLKRWVITVLSSEEETHPQEGVGGKKKPRRIPARGFPLPPSSSSSSGLFFFRQTPSPPMVVSLSFGQELYGANLLQLFRQNQRGNKGTNKFIHSSKH
jgi:hypothetical protein